MAHQPGVIIGLPLCYWSWANALNAVSANGSASRQREQTQINSILFSVEIIYSQLKPQDVATTLYEPWFNRHIAAL
jgi:hypothetical protein